MTSRPYFSIGEVLGLLLEEFPDITISKIRFLESQGLIDPERTPSGYRKFYENDLERLRFILREQKDRYLPLRVIKERLETSDDTLPMTPRPIPSGASWATAPRAREEMPVPVGGGHGVAHGSPHGTATPIHGPGHDVSVVARLMEAPESVMSAVRATASSHVPAPDPAPGPPPSVGASGAPPAADGAPVDPVPSTPAPAPVTPAGGDAASPAGSGHRGPRARDDRQLDAGELCAEAGIDRKTLDELESFGLISSRALGGAAVYGADALHIARVAGKLTGHGLEVRHLRTWRMNADKESALFEQLVVPLVRQRNPQARHQTAEMMEELLELGGQLREALLRSATQQYLEH